MSLEELKDDDRTLVVIALQALHHERVKAWNIAFTASELSGKKPPSKEFFRIREAEDALRRIGAAPEW